jgi:uncharacterized membrane protein YphA (DoxX/SURF4 family)
MSKRKKIIYWIATGWLALGMISTGIVQLLQVDENIQPILELGYPAYFLIILGLWKILGAIVVLIPRSPLLKEWAYAGFFFAMSGAVFSHLASGSPPTDFLPPLLLLTLTLVSWYLRPQERRIMIPA